ncbi:MAG: leucine-rich repeat domain-containing protein [Oscillospiraceae bacterium]|nr:leucine-rich repeat domain-containing protein [Oscillospiraceae bacterium]
MKRKLLAILIAGAIMITTVSGYNLSITKEEVSLSDGAKIVVTTFDDKNAPVMYIRGQGLTNEQLAELVDLGIITDDSGTLDLSNNQLTDVSVLFDIKLEGLNVTRNPLEKSPVNCYETVNTADGLGWEYCCDVQHSIDAVAWDGGLDGAIDVRDSYGILIGEDIPTFADAIAILRYGVGLPSVLDESDYALAAACIVSEGEPGVADALQVIRYIVMLPTVFDDSERYPNTPSAEERIAERELKAQ